MENAILGQCPEAHIAYDYRMYDRIWQRVSPDLNPYPEVRAAAGASGTPVNMPSAPSPAAPVSAPASVPVTAPPVSAPVSVPKPGLEVPAAPAAVEPAAAVSPAAVSPAAVSPAAAAPASGSSAAESRLPGAEVNPCCMGTQAMESLEVLEGFIEEELAERRCCLSLCRRVRNSSVVRLLKCIAAEKQCAAREMCTAYYLITGQRYTPAITVEQVQWDNLTAALRSCYHQEACNSFNYERAADGTVDQCLQKLFMKLSRQSSQRADEVMCVLGQVLC